MKVTVTIPTVLKEYTRGSSEVEVDASTVGEAVLRLDELFPGLQAFLLDEAKQLRRFVNIFVDRRDIRSVEGLTTKLKDGDRIQIIPAVAGG